MRKTYVQSANGKAGLRDGRASYLLLWLLGVPVPVLLLIYLLNGCH